MSDDAFRILGLEPGADARSVEAAYWKLAKEVASRRDNDVGANGELELLNNAYQSLSKDFVYGTRNTAALQATKKGKRRRYLLVAAVLGGVAAGLVGGLSYRAEITDGAKAGYEQGEESLNDTVDWLQELDGTPTPEKPGKGQQPNQP